jgi:hypothetical protein
MLFDSKQIYNQSHAEEWIGNLEMPRNVSFAVLRSSNQF